MAANAMSTAILGGFSDVRDKKFPVVGLQHEGKCVATTGCKPYQLSPFKHYISTRPLRPASILSCL